MTEVDRRKLIHILYLSDNKPVCHWPARLDHMSDFVLNQGVREGEVGCKECTSLLIAHNIKQSFIEKQQKNYGIAYMPSEIRTNNGFRGMMYGLLFASFFWAIVIALFIAF